MDGMYAKNSTLKTVVFLAVLLIPFVLSGLSFSKPISTDNTTYRENSASSCNSIVVAGDFQYFEVKLTSVAEKISIVAFYGDSIPEIKDRSPSNYYKWEYNNGAWIDASGHDAEYIKTSECKKENSTYYFYISLDNNARPGHWNFKIIIDGKEKVTYTYSIVVVAQFNFFLSALVALYQPNTRDKESIFEIDLIVSERKKMAMAPKENIDDVVDEVISKSSISDNKEKKDEIQDLFYSEIKPNTKDECSRAIVSNYQRSRLKNLPEKPTFSIFKKNLGGVNGFNLIKSNGHSRFLVSLFTILLLFTAFVPIISPYETTPPENITDTDNIQNDTNNTDLNSSIPVITPDETNPLENITDTNNTQNNTTNITDLNGFIQVDSPYETIPFENITDTDNIQNDTANITGLNITLKSNNELFFINETILFNGAVNYNNALIDLPVNLQISSYNYSLSEVLQTINGEFSYKFVPLEPDNYYANVSVSFENFSAKNYLDFDVIEIKNSKPKVNNSKKNVSASPFDIIESSTSSLGPKLTKTVNTSYFWNFFDNYNNWYLESWDSQKNMWVDVSNHLNVVHNKSSDNQFEKISLEFKAPKTTDYKVTFLIDTPLKRFVNNSNQFDYELVYQVEDDEEYTTHFNFSDMASIPGVILNHGVNNNNGSDIFWFSAQKNNVLAGTNVVLDPTFGNTGTSTSTTTIENSIRGGYFQMGSNTGYGISITAYLSVTNTAKNAKCALYDSSQNLVANSMTEQISIPISNAWYTFNFSSTKPVLTANAWYYIVAWSVSAAGNGLLYYATTGGSGVFSHALTYVAGSYNGFPSPFTATVVAATGLASIYCNYYETTPPTPNPLTWVTAPYNASSSSITMVATTASDNTPPISYYFNETTGNSGGTDSGWQASTTYTDSGLSENTQYGYEVKARDSNSTPNEGSYSTPVSYQYTDVDPPTNNELTFSIGTTWINASVAQPPNPTSGSTGSYFNWVTGGAANSGWQTSVYYHNRTGLTENTQYGAQVRYRNGDGDASTYNPNEKTNYTYCEPPTDGEFTIDTYAKSWINMSVAQPTNPATGSTAAYFECVTGGAGSSGWVTNSASGRYYYLATGLTPGTTYGFRVKYRNADTVETAYTIEKQQTTNLWDPPIVTTNATTGVEETNATLNGYLQNNGGTSSTCGFRYGTTSGSYTQNFSVGIIANATEFSNNNGSLTPGQLYFYQAWATNVMGFANGGEMTFLTKPNPPITGNFTVRANNTITIYLNWTQGTGANNTYIERNTTASWTRGQGTVVYNGTGINCEDTGLVPGTTYYYQAWSYATWTYTTTIYQFSDNYESGNGKTKSPPYQTGEAPTTGTTGICPIPNLYVVCRDNDTQDTMNVTWMSNSSGAWVQFATNNNIANNTNITQINTNFSSPGTTYYWSINLTDGTNWTNATYSFMTNYAPTQSGESPTNGATNVQTTPPLYVICTDTDTGQTMTATWRSNSSGTWQTFATNNGITTGTNITQTNPNFNNPSTTYYWSINLTDGCNWTNTTYSFTTMPISTSVNTISPYNITTNPLQISATGTSVLDNVTLWYRWSTNNASWSFDTQYVESMDTSSYSTNTNWQTKATITINPSTTSSYVILATANVMVASTTVRIGARLTIAGSTCQELYYLPKDTTDWYPFNAFKVINISSSTTINLDYKTYTAGTAANIREARIIVLKVPYSAYDEDEGRVTTTSANWQTASSITVTPSGTSQNFIVIATANLDGSLITESAGARVYNSDGTTITDYIEEPGVATTAKMTFGSLSRVTLTQTRTISLDYCSETSMTTGIQYSHIVAIPESVFNNVYYSNNDAEVSPAVASTWYTKVSNVYTPIAGDHLIIGMCQDRCQATASSSAFRLTYNGISDNGYLKEDKDTTDYRSSFTMNRSTLTATQKTDSIDYMGEATTADFKNSRLYSLELTPSYAIGYNWSIWSNASNPDTSSPWSWNFNFPNSTGYYEFYSIGKKAGSTDEAAPASADTRGHYQLPPIVTTNASTGVEDINATLNGYLQSDGGEAADCGIRYGTTSGSYTQNFTKGTYTSNTPFSNNNGSLTSGDLYYVQAWAKNTGGFSTGNELTFFTEPPQTTNLAESNSTSTTLTYTWTKPTVGTGATAYTHIRYKTGSNPTTITDGTNTYNNTDTTDNTINLEPGTHYYFSAFSWATEGGIGQWNDTYATMNAWTNPGDPTTGTITRGTNWINITFTHGTNGSYTKINRNNTGNATYPGTREDGTQVANTTDQYINDTSLTSGTTYYYTLWTWDTDGQKWCDTNKTIAENTLYPPIINSYNLLNNTGSKLNNATGLLDINTEYYFTIDVTDYYGWENIAYIDITSWYDNGDDNAVYNQTLGGNLNMFLRYENTSGVANFRMLWPDDEAQIILANCNERIINSNTRVVNISFKILNQVRWASSNDSWDATQNVYNDPYSWNFKITVLDEADGSSWKIGEYGVYKFTSVYTSKDWVDVYALPGFSDTSNVVTVTYSSNYNFNMTLYFEENLRNETWGVNIPIANNINILANADLNDDITTDMTFLGIGQSYAIDIFNISGVFHADNVSQTVNVQFEVYIPIGTLGLKYTARVATKIIQK